MSEDIFGKFVEKGWGNEYWIVNKKEYCGKILHLDKGKKCSFHFHAEKDEVFFLLSGKLLIKLSDKDDLELAREFEFNTFDIVNIYPGLRHQMIALEDSDLLEISTHHEDSDSYRVTKGD